MAEGAHGRGPVRELKKGALPTVACGECAHVGTTGKSDSGSVTACGPCACPGSHPSTETIVIQ